MDFDSETIDEDDGVMYEAVLQEIAMEGLDGITLQALWERLRDRPEATIGQGESVRVKSSVWGCIIRDPRLSLYLLPEPRPKLRIWNRKHHTDAKGNVEEPKDAPEDVYTFKSVEVPVKDSKIKNEKKTKSLSTRNVRLVDLKSSNKEKVEVEIEGIRFSRPKEPKPASKAERGRNSEKRNGQSSSSRKSSKSKSAQRQSKSIPKSTPSKSKGKEKTQVFEIDEEELQVSKSTSGRSRATTKKQDESPPRKSQRGKTVEDVPKVATVTKPTARSKTMDAKSSKSKVAEAIKEKVVKSNKRSKNVEQVEKTSTQKKKPVKKGKKGSGKADDKGSESEEVNKKGDGNDEDEPEEKTKGKLLFIRGSCEHFYTRKDVSKQIRKKRLTYRRAIEIFGSRLAIVACQFLREVMLFSRNNQMRLASQQYGMVERIGRARHHGEQARGKVSLTCLKIDSKTQFYHRKLLLAERLITKQGFIMRFPENRTGTLISVFHLPHYYQRLESSEAVNIRKIVYSIYNSPSHTAEYYKVQNCFGKHLMRVMNDSYREFIEHAEESYAVMHPEEFAEERKAARREQLLKRKVKVIKLKAEDFNDLEIIRKVIEKQLSTKEEDDDTFLNMPLEDGHDEDEEEFEWSVCHSKKTEFAHEFEATTLLKFVISRGHRGLLLQDIARYMEVNHLDARSASRYLLRWKLVNTITEEHEKFKLARYVYGKCEGPLHKVGFEEYDENGILVALSSVKTEVKPKEKTSRKHLGFRLTVPVDPCAEVDLKTSPVVPSVPTLEATTSSTTRPITALQVAKKKIINKPGPKSVKVAALAKLEKSFETPLLPAPEIIEVSEIPENAPEVPLKKDRSWKTVKTAKKRVSKFAKVSSIKKDEGAVAGPSVKSVTSDKQPGSLATIELSNIQTEVSSVRKPITTSATIPAKPTKQKSAPKPKRLQPHELSLQRVKQRLLIDGENKPVRVAKPRPKRKSKEPVNEDGKSVDEGDSRPLKKLKTDRYYDDIDRKALGLLKKQRVDWTAHEDRLLLHLFVSSILFIPRYNMHRVFIFNSSQIRDILHRSAEESKTKTSVAVRRRLHFLMKNRIFYAKYRNLLNIALRDEHLYSNFVEKHLPKPSMNIYHRIPTEGLIKVHEYLMSKFHDKLEVESVDTNYAMSLEEVISVRELRRLEGIWVDIWGTLFREKKEGIEEPEYPGGFDFPSANAADSAKKQEKEATDDDCVFLEDETNPPKAKVSRMETETESVNPPVPADSVPELPVSYLDEEIQYAYHVSKTLIENIGVSESDDSDDDLSPRASTSTKKGPKKSGKETRFLSLKEKQRGLYSKSDIVACKRDADDQTDVVLWAGRTALLSMVFSAEVLETVQTFMASVADANLERVLGSLRSLGIVSETRVTNRLCLSFAMRKQLIKFVGPTSFRIANNLLTSLSEKPVTSLQNFSHLGAVYLLSDLSLLLKVKVTVPECIITVHDKWKKDYDLLLGDKATPAKDKENFACRTIRIRLNEDAGKTGKFVEKDFFDINLPQVFVEVKKGIRPEKIVYGDSKCDPVHDKIYLENTLIQFVEYDEIYDRFGAPDEERDTRKYSWLYDVIDVTEELGISMHYLLKAFNREKVKSGLAYLLDCNYIYTVGIFNRKFVSGTWMKKWTTEVVTKGDKPKRVVMRPWVNARGGLNWNLLDRAYIGIIGYLQRYPVIMVQQLCQCLAPIFSHVEIILLLSTLIHLKIVGVYRMTKTKSSGLFTKPRKGWESDLEMPFKDYNVDVFLDMEGLFVELMPCHTVKYARLQQAIHPNKVDNPMTTVEEDHDEVLMRDEGVVSNYGAIVGLSPSSPDDEEEEEDEEEEDSDAGHNPDDFKEVQSEEEKDA